MHSEKKIYIPWLQNGPHKLNKENDLFFPNFSSRKKKCPKLGCFHLTVAISFLIDIVHWVFPKE